MATATAKKPLISLDWLAVLTALVLVALVVSGVLPAVTW